MASAKQVPEKYTGRISCPRTGNFSSKMTVDRVPDQLPKPAAATVLG